MKENITYLYVHITDGIYILNLNCSKKKNSVPNKETSFKKWCINKCNMSNIGFSLITNYNKLEYGFIS